jgi:hypothetical protein
MEKKSWRTLRETWAPKKGNIDIDGNIYLPSKGRCPLVCLALNNFLHTIYLFIGLRQ